MVLSLVDLSLFSIANGIKNGAIQHPHLLPPKLRQQVLNTVLLRGLINDSRCMALLSSVEFLNGMESFGTEPGQYELVFLNHLEESMATMLQNGETVGAGITHLDLSVYGCLAIGNGGRPVKASSFPLVSHLIAQCPNATKLALRGIMSKLVLDDCHRSNGRTSWFPAVLNENNTCTMVMENLVELSLRDMKNVLSSPSDRPFINFKRLSTLKLDNCSIKVNIWAEFLLNIPTLENLQMIGVKGVGIYDKTRHPDANGLDWILPLSMSHLKKLEVISVETHQFIYECSKAFVDNLMGCPEICRVHLSLDQKSTDEESMERLANMDIDLRVKARFIVRVSDEIRAALDASSKLKVVRIFHERMDSLKLIVWRKWNPQLSTALENVTDSCSKLTTFGLHIPDKSYLSDATEIEPVEMNRINAAMVQFFGNRERATQLRDLRLRGNIDEAVMLAIFEYCLNLDRLEIWFCSAVRDQHLIDWVTNGGGKLAHLEVFSRRNITSEGIIPVLAKSAQGLLSISVYVGQGSGDGRNWETVLNNVCPNAKSW